MDSNADFPWDDFDAVSYLRHNYVELRDDDAQIVERLGDFFATAAIRPGARGVDVGAGTNLYPALSMLPFCGSLTLREFSRRNIAWLEREVHSYSESWDPFWKLLTGRREYAAVQSPRDLLAERASVVQGSVFDLPRGEWDAGTMFFVAESISPDRAEFEAATWRFVGSLRRGAPFAAAFMENSQGYDVGTQHFPAVAVTVDDVHGALAGVATDVVVSRIETDAEPLRAGYTGMIFAHGRSNTE